MTIRYFACTSISQFKIGVQKNSGARVSFIDMGNSSVYHDDGPNTGRRVAHDPVLLPEAGTYETIVDHAA